MRAKVEFDQDGLTKRQRAILDFIVHTMTTSGRPPSTREISLEFDIKSPNGSASHLKALEKKGFVVLDHKTSRGIMPVVPDGCCKACGRSLV